MVLKGELLFNEYEGENLLQDSNYHQLYNSEGFEAVTYTAVPFDIPRNLATPTIGFLSVLGVMRKIRNLASKKRVIHSVTETDD